MQTLGNDAVLLGALLCILTLHSSVGHQVCKKDLPPAPRRLMHSCTGLDAYHHICLRDSVPTWTPSWLRTAIRTCHPKSPATAAREIDVETAHFVGNTEVVAELKAEFKSWAAGGGRSTIRKIFSGKHGVGKRAFARSLARSFSARVHRLYPDSGVVAMETSAHSILSDDPLTNGSALASQFAEHAKSCRNLSMLIIDDFHLVPPPVVRSLLSQVNNLEESGTFVAAILLSETDAPFSKSTSELERLLTPYTVHRFETPSIDERKRYIRIALEEELRHKWECACISWTPKVIEDLAEWPEFGSMWKVKDTMNSALGSFHGALATRRKDLLANKKELMCHFLRIAEDGVVEFELDVIPVEQLRGPRKDRE